MGVHLRNNPPFTYDCTRPTQPATDLERRFEVADKTAPPHLPDLVEQTAQGVRIQIFFPFRGLEGEVTVGYECDIHDPQSRHLTAEECAHIAMMEADPADPKKASQLEVPDKHNFFANFYIETFLVQPLKAGTRVDISRDIFGKRVLVAKGTKLEVHLTPVPNLQLAGPD